METIGCYAALCDRQATILHQICHFGRFVKNRRFRGRASLLLVLYCCILWLLPSHPRRFIGDISSTDIPRRSNSVRADISLDTSCCSADLVGRCARTWRRICCFGNLIISRALFLQVLECCILVLLPCHPRRFLRDTPSTIVAWIPSDTFQDAGNSARFCCWVYC